MRHVIYQKTLERGEETERRERATVSFLYTPSTIYTVDRARNVFAFIAKQESNQTSYLFRLPLPFNDQGIRMCLTVHGVFDLLHDRRVRGSSFLDQPLVQ